MDGPAWDGMEADYDGAGGSGGGWAVTTVDWPPSWPGPSLIDLSYHMIYDPLPLLLVQTVVTAVGYKGGWQVSGAT